MSDVFNGAPEGERYTQATFIPHLGELLSPDGDDDGANRGCVEALYLHELDCGDFDVAVGGSVAGRSMPRALKEMVDCLLDSPRRTLRKLDFDFSSHESGLDDGGLEDLAGELTESLREEHGVYLRVCPGSFMQDTPSHRNGGFGPAASDSSGTDDEQ